MATAAQYPHLTVADDGSIRIGSSRYKMIHLAAEHYHYGWTAEELLRQHADLRPEEVYSALAYFYDHRDDVLQKLVVSADVTTADVGKSLSRAELLQRKAAKGA
jgi:uncharacterized protein (DUF433 family)